MAKGYYYPELLAVHTYSENPKETFGYLQTYTDTLREAFLALESGKPAKGVRLDGQPDDLDRAIAFGSLVHEYIHHLQYTSRRLGLLFYECRHAQSLWTHRCLKELREENTPPLIPLMRYATSTDAPNSILQRWREKWVEYEGLIAIIGMGTWLQVQGSFSQDIARDWFAAMGANAAFINGDQLSWADMLETEAEIITGEILHGTFPNVHAEARNALGESKQTLIFRERGLHRLIPLLCDYCMQSRLVVENRPVNPRVLFDTAIETVEKRYAGIEYAEIVKHGAAILATVQEATGLPPLSELLATAEDEFSKLASMASTPLGVLLQRGIQFRRTHPTWFTTLHAFLVLIMQDFPVPTWYYFNSNHYTDRPNQGSFFGDLDAATLPVLFQRLCLWAAREIALRPGSIICPECRLNEARECCTGTCGFVQTCICQFSFDPCKREWTIEEKEKDYASKIPVRNTSIGHAT
jgi:hypothetical protein